MCHHFKLLNEAKELAKQFKARIANPQQAIPIGDFYPLHQVAVVRLDNAGEREIVSMEWGLLPFWWKPSDRHTSRKSFQRKCFNARGETIATKPAFRESFKHRRCLILASSFFERGHYFHLPDNKLFAMAGLWERWLGESEPIETCTIVTTTPNSEVRAVGHHRMPVTLLSDANIESWLIGDSPEKAIGRVEDGVFLD